MNTAGRWVVVLGVVLGLGVAAVSADEPTPAGGGQDRVEELMGRYNLYPAFEKLGRGVANLLGGWLEVPLNIHKRFAKSDTAGSFFTGAVHGLFKGVVRTGVGAYETVTFFLPYPEHFAPILPTLEYFQQHTRREPLPLE